MLFKITEKKRAVNSYISSFQRFILIKKMYLLTPLQDTELRFARPPFSSSCTVRTANVTVGLQVITEWKTYDRLVVSDP